MTGNIIINVTPLILAAVIGYLAQWIGLCMVRGVKELLAGKPSFIVAIVCCGLWSWVAGLAGSYIGHAVPFHYFENNIWFVLGGFLFGVGSAINHGCGISTLSRLSRGELQMLATVVGWIVGWIILARWPVHMASLVEVNLIPTFVLPVLVAGSIVITGWVFIGSKKRQRTWLSIMSIGLLAGILFVFEPSWSPSSLLQDISGAVLADQDPTWPKRSRYQIFLALLSGMMIAAWRHKRFLLVVPTIVTLSVHLLAGLLMGLGGAMAIGGNDAQLLLALPTLSVSSIITVLSMLVGIIGGLKMPALIRNIRGLTDNG